MESTLFSSSSSSVSNNSKSSSGGGGGSGGSGGMGGGGGGGRRQASEPPPPPPPPPPPATIELKESMRSLCVLTERRQRHKSADGAGVGSLRYLGSSSLSSPQSARAGGGGGGGMGAQTNMNETAVNLHLKDFSATHQQKNHSNNNPHPHLNRRRFSSVFSAVSELMFGGNTTSTSNNRSPSAGSSMGLSTHGSIASRTLDDLETVKFGSKDYIKKCYSSLDLVRAAKSEEEHHLNPPPSPPAITTTVSPSRKMSLISFSRTSPRSPLASTRESFMALPETNDNNEDDMEL